MNSNLLDSLEYVRECYALQSFFGSKTNGLLQFAAQTYHLRGKMYSELFAVDRDVYIPREALKNVGIYMLHPHRLQQVHFDVRSAANNICEVERAPAAYPPVGLDVREEEVFFEGPDNL